METPKHASIPYFSQSVLVGVIAVLSSLPLPGQTDKPAGAAATFESIKARAETNDVEAQLTLGSMYDSGQGVTRDQKQAVNWWLKAAVQGQPVARYNVGVMYEAGQGVEQDSAEAATWWRKTPEPMDSLAMYQLGWLSATGSGVPKSYSDARELWTAAAKQGFVVAKRELDFVETRVNYKDGTMAGRVEMVRRAPAGDVAFRGYRTAQRELELDRVSFAYLDGKLVDNVHVVMTTPASIFYRLPNGICCGEAKLDQQPAGIQRQFGYDPKKAAAYEAAQTQSILAEETGTRRSEASRNRQAPLAPAIAESEKSKIVAEIVDEYHKTHTYVGKQTGAKADIFVCGDMACEVWNIAETKGIKARIQIGNVEKKMKSFRDADHAWVMAEVSPGRWLALETTGGFVVSYSKNPNYYSGYYFSDPKQFREYGTLAREHAMALSKHQGAVEDYNQVVARFNRANLYGQQVLGVELDRKASVVEARNDDLNEVIHKLKVLLSADE